MFINVSFPHEKINQCLTDIRQCLTDILTNINQYLTDTENQLFEILIISVKYRLKLVSAIFYHIFIFSPNDSPLKTMKNVFYFI